MKKTTFYLIFFGFIYGAIISATINFVYLYWIIPWKIEMALKQSGLLTIAKCDEEIAKQINSIRFMVDTECKSQDVHSK